MYSFRILQCITRVLLTRSCHVALHYGKNTVWLKPPVPGSNPGTVFPWDVTVLFKIHTIFFTVCVDQSTLVLLILLIPAWGSPLSNGFLQVCRDRITEWMSAGQQNKWRLWRKLYPRDHFGSIKAASRTLVCVCALVSNECLYCNRRDCFLQFRFGLFPCPLHTPPPPIFPVTRRITRKTGYKN